MSLRDASIPPNTTGSGNSAPPSSMLPSPQPSTLPGVSAPSLPASRTSPLPIGTQSPLRASRAFLIAVRGIRIRLGRSLLTLSGVALGIAFLMSTVTTQFINRAVAREQASRQQLNLMESVLKTQIGAVAGKTLAVAVFGAVSPQESALLERIRAEKPARLRAYGGPAGAGIEKVPLTELARDATALLLLGDAPQCPVPLADLTAGMTTRLVLDGRADRECLADATVRREVFFARQSDGQRERLARQSAGERFRTIWIVVISLAVTMIGVANALLMSVTERFREIGTMKCLGALSSFIRRLFLIESALIGLAGSMLGVLTGTLLTMVVYGGIYGFGLVFGTIAYSGLLLAALLALVVGTILAMLAALYPAHVASRMLPAAALRSTV